MSGHADPLQWSSENPALAKVDPVGVTRATVTGVAPGSVAIRATAGRSSAAANITVHIATPDADSFRRSEAYITGQIARAVARGQRGF